MAGGVHYASSLGGGDKEVEKACRKFGNLSSNGSFEQHVVLYFPRLVFSSGKAEFCDQGSFGKRLKNSARVFLHNSRYVTVLHHLLHIWIISRNVAKFHKRRQIFPLQNFVGSWTRSSFNSMKRHPSIDITFCFRNSTTLTKEVEVQKTILLLLYLIIIS